MSKGTKNLIIAVLILAAISVAGFYGNKNGWFAVNKTATVSTPTDYSTEKARADAAEAKLKKMEQEKAEADKKIAETIEVIDRMEKMIADTNQPQVDQIATPAPANPADTATVVIPVKKKSGVGG